MDKRNVTGLAVMAAASVVLIAASDPLYNSIQKGKLEAAAGGEEIVTVTGEGEGFEGPITAEVTLAGDRIIGLKLAGEKETPEIGGAALAALQEQILANGGLDGVDAVSGATWTSNGAFAAIRSAMGIEEPEPAAAEQEAPAEVTASGLTHGLGIYSSGRLGPGKDDQGTGVYSINEVAAYVLFDGDGRIVDLEVDQLEVATPNYDGEHMPNLTGFPGQSYNADEDHDEKVDAVLEQTEEAFLAQVDGWKTKRERGNTYKLGSGTWEEEMDIFEETFKGMTVEEVRQWYEAYCSDLNGKPLHGTSDKEEDVKKYEALSDAEKADLDAISGATMSLTDAHGDILAAIERAWENKRPVSAEKIARIGLGFTNTGRLGPGKDDQDVGVYSFNTQIVGTCFDENGAIAAIYTDVMEVATPNYDGEHMPNLTGFPGQSYNADEDHDEKVDTVLEQTEESFLAEVASWKTKRERGTTYKLGAGTWADEMDLFEEKFTGMTADEVEAWYNAYCSDLNGRPLHGTSDKEEDVKKYEALSDAEKADLDAISGATMSLKDAHGDILGAILKSWENAKDTNIAASGAAPAAQIVEIEGGLQIGQAYGAAHGTSCYTEAVAVVQDDTIVAAYLDDFQFLDVSAGVTGVPNSDSDFAANYAEGKVLCSKRDNAEYYSKLMSEKGGATVSIDGNYDAIQNFVVGKTIDELEALAGSADAVDAVSGATLADTAGYIGVIVDAAKNAKGNQGVEYSGNSEDLKLSVAYAAAHGTKCFASAAALTEGDTIVLSYIDEFQFISSDAGVTGVPNSTESFGENVTGGAWLCSKRDNAAYYSKMMAEKGGSTVAIDVNYDAIQAHLNGMSIADVAALSADENAVDAVSGATLVDTAGYVAAVAAAAGK